MALPERRAIAACSIGLLLCAPPLALADITIRFSADDPSRIEWTTDQEPASFGLYRNGECIFTELTTPLAVDREIPDPGQAFRYVVSAQNPDPTTGALVESDLGTDSSGRPRSFADRTFPCGRRVFVDPDAAGRGTGLSWADAYTTIAAALQHPGDRERQTLEVWTAGPIVESVSTPFLRARLLGGFAGTERFPWERDVAGSPTPWTPADGDPAVDSHAIAIALDGFLFHDAQTAVRMRPWDDHYLRLSRCRFENNTARHVYLDGPGDASDAAQTVEVDRCDFDEFVNHAILADSYNLNRLNVVLRANVFRGAVDSVISASTFCDTGVLCDIDLYITGNLIQGGLRGLDLESFVVHNSGTSLVHGLIASNTILGPSEEGIRVFAAAYHESKTVRAENTVEIIGNTIVRAGGSGILVEGDASNTSIAVVRPEIWNNVIADCGGFAIEEGPEKPGLNVHTDPLVVGNDLFGCAAAYLDEGTRILQGVYEVNLLDDAWDNLELAPRFAAPDAGDFHLRIDSPLIDRGHIEAPHWPATDIDGQPRQFDATGAGFAVPDIGADEVMEPVPGNGTGEESLRHRNRQTP